MTTILLASIALATTVSMAYSALGLFRRAAAGSAGSSTVVLSGQHPTLLQARIVCHPRADSPVAAPSRVTGLSRREAEDLLDWLEATGRGAGQLSYNGQDFSVQWN